jgi:internalin A
MKDYESLEGLINKNIDLVRIHGWQHLNLRNCGLERIPTEVFDFTELVLLDLGNDQYCEEENKNRITLIPDDIAKLKKLATLIVSNNKISHISESISELRNLKSLDLSNNKLVELSDKIANMSSLIKLNLADNPFDMLPPEIIARGIDSIRNFFKELEEKDFLYEVKLIVVGEGRVGKTCLSQALISNDYVLSDEESTEGININRWVIPQSEISVINPKIQRDFQINIWDFGGQEIYHSTHQFFLTKRSIYLLVTESRKEDSHDDFFYWLNVIKLLGDKSPVVMVLNKCDQPTKELPIKEYKDAFNNIVDLYKVSLKDEFKDDFKLFKKTLSEIASNLPHIGNPLPKVWVDIRIEIEHLKLAGINYISESEYLEICKKHYRKEESALFLSEYFHDLGVLLHFKDDIDLRDMVVLNHEWITSGVYKILDDKKVISQHGRFALEDIRRIWAGDEYKDKVRELLSLMKNKKFDLCFELDNGEYLVPRLLPVDEIEHNWETSAENLKFEFRYKFMPKGILTRMIVKLNSDILDTKYWRYGVILKYENTTAIIKEKYFENKITIEIAGTDKREYLFIIRKALKDIHSDFNKLKVQEMIPCTCQMCLSIDKPYFFDFDLLRRYEFKNLKNIRCENSLEEVNVLELTADVKMQTSSEVIVVCENQNADILNLLGFENMLFYGERDSASVFVNIKSYKDRHGLRDRDFLTDTEIQRIKNSYPNYSILEYYCFENYLFHPDNIEELKLSNFQKEEYIAEIIKQKNQRRNHIISIFKNARNTYQEFKIPAENLKIKSDEEHIIKYLESDDLEIFFKSYSMKDHYDKAIIRAYNLKHTELAKTEWFKNKIGLLLNMN